jgi:hypothetical protein
MSATKNDLILAAYEEMRISGLTVIPTANDNDLALRHLENLMAQLAGRNICVGYNFEENPNLSSLHNLERVYWYPIQMLLADRLLPSFGKTGTPEFIRNRSAAQSFLSSKCALIKQVPYPSRMPAAPGSEFYYPSETAPMACTTHQMFIGDIEDFTESYTQYLKAGETIASYVLTADTGLTIESESLSSPVISYQVNAEGNSGAEETLQVKIVATTSDGRVTTRIIYFELVSSDVIS